MSVWKYKIFICGQHIADVWDEKAIKMLTTGIFDEYYREPNLDIHIVREDNSIQRANNE